MEDRLRGLLNFQQLHSGRDQPTYKGRGVQVQGTALPLLLQVLGLQEVVINTDAEIHDVDAGLQR